MELDCILDLLDYFNEKKETTIIDIFPYKISEDNSNYWEIEEYLLTNEFNSFLNKIFLVFIKFICYYEYDFVIIEKNVNNDSEYTPMDSKSVKISDLKNLFTVDLCNRTISSVSFYFKKIDLLFYVDSDSLIACIKGLNTKNKVYDLLKKFTIGEGLFIK